VEFEPGSYRDRTGRVFYAGGEVFRALTPRALGEWEALAATRFFPRLVREGKVVATERTAIPPQLPDGAWAAALRHERIPFVSYPYEWCFGMLKAAALLQLELLAAALAEEMSLKDATPFNVQWHGARPVFIDVLSFYRLQAGEPWVGYRQFCEQFLYPLLLAAYRGVPFRPWLRGRLDGIPPHDADRLLAGRDRLRRGVFTHVHLHARSEARWDRTTSQNVKRELAAAGFSKQLIVANVRGLGRLISGLAPAERKSAWSDYGDDPGYAAADREAKERFVREAAASRRWRLVWDLGANTGVYSRLAAEHADYVVALDADEAAIERLFAEARRAGRGNLLPLVCDLADPSPALGWRGSERKTLPERGRPELILCLALVHHLVIGANLGLEDLLDWLRGLGGSLVIEFVRRRDPMVVKLLRHRDERYDDYDEERFAAALAARYDVVGRRELPSGLRTLYFARPRPEGARAAEQAPMP
jgi:SAM-dependent methyltransferase